MKALLAVVAVLLLLGWPCAAQAALGAELGACAVLCELIRRAARGWPRMTFYPWSAP